MIIYIAEAVYQDSKWNFNPIEYIEEFESIIWTKRWQDCGDFVLTMPSKALKEFDSYEDLLDKFIVCKNEKIPESHERIENDYMFIESYSITFNLDNMAMLTLKGRDLLSILNRRIIWGQKVFSNQSKSQICDSLVTSEIITPNSVEGGNYRKIQGFGIIASAIDTIIPNIQFTGDNLLTAILDVCGDECSPKVETLRNQSIVFSLYKGNETTLVFAQDLDNLESYEEYQSVDSYCNAWMVAGEGEGTDRKTVEFTWQGGAVKRWGIGLNRREKFIDARDISSNEGEIADDVYLQMLQQRGQDKRLDTWISRVSTAEIIPSNIKYGEDYMIGDIITIVDMLGNKHRARITEYIRCEDANGYQEYPSFEFI